MNINSIKAIIETKLSEMNAAAEITFISASSFSIHSEDAASFEAAKNILTLANQTLDSEEHDAECGHFAYFTMGVAA